MDVKDFHRKALGAFGERVEGTPPEAWRQPTPCDGWDVRALVNHVVSENRWAVLLLGGATVAEVGRALDGDLLGEDALAAWHDSADGVRDAVAATPLETTVHLSFGDVPASEYLWQLTTDALVHAWDLAHATGQDETLPADVVAACAAWFDSAEADYRAAGVIGPAVAVDADDPLAVLLGRFGRNPSPDDPLAAVVRFLRAFNAHDIGTLAPLLTDDCRFVDTSPPDGTAHVDREAVLAAFDNLFTSTPSATFRVEGGFVHADRVVIRWRYDWREGGGGHVRGVDLFTMRNGRIAEKLSYVKG